METTQPYSSDTRQRHGCCLATLYHRYGAALPNATASSVYRPGSHTGLCPVGLLVGALSALLTVAVYAAEDGFRKLPIHWMWWPAIGGVVIGIGGLIFPQALGVGYDTIRGVIYRMAETGFTRFPVVESADSPKLVGMISLNDLLTAMNRSLAEERHRERILRIRTLFPSRSRTTTERITKHDADEATATTITSDEHSQLAP